jgi:hypothetical protein
MGKPGFPVPLREDQALPRAGAWGNPVAPHPRSKGPGVAEYLLKDHEPPGQHGTRDDMSPDICIGG